MIFVNEYKNIIIKLTEFFGNHFKNSEKQKMKCNFQGSKINKSRARQSDVLFSSTKKKENRKQIFSAGIEFKSINIRFNESLRNWF